MKLRLSGLVILVCLLTAVSASGGQMFGPDVEVDTTDYPNIQNFFLSPFQLTDYNFLGGGARARAMGGAFFAVADDPTAASWNPAGLMQLDKPQMNLSFSSYVGRTEYTSTQDSPIWNYSFGDEQEYDANAISFASVVIPSTLRDREVVFSALYQKQANIYQDNRHAIVIDEVMLWSGGDTTVYSENYALPPITEKTKGELNVLNFSVATKLMESLAFGAGVNIYTGNFTTDVDFFYPVVGLDIDPNDGDLLPLIDVTQRNGWRLRPHTENEYSGFNFTLGLMYTLKKLSLAGVVKTPFTLKEDNDLKLYTDIIEEGQVHPFSYLFSPFFDTDRKWDMPTMVGFGASYQVNSLTLAADVEWRNYSKTELTYRRNIANPEDPQITTGDYVADNWWGEEGNEPPFVPSLNWRDLTQFRVGAEYVIGTGLGDIPLRVGFRTDPQLYTAQLESGEVYLRKDFTQFNVIGTDTIYNDQPRFLQSNYGVNSGSWVEGKVISFGTGIAWSQIKLDLTYEFAQYDDVSNETSTYVGLFRQSQTAAPWFSLHKKMDEKRFTREESNKYSRIMVSFTGFF
jgi:long-subunit fatty acid transport protein